ncbi:hypothetical protein ACQQ67_11120 [Corynebacterium diphtheriae]
MPQESEDLKKAVETKKNTKSSRLKPKSCSKKSRPRQKDQETRVNAIEAAHQKEYDKLAEQAKHETEEEARHQTEFKKEREKHKQKDKARLEREKA